jgi:hypothetical protein
MKTTPLRACAKLHMLVDIQQKVVELVLSITSCPKTLF